MKNLQTRHIVSWWDGILGDSSAEVVERKVVQTSSRRCCPPGSCPDWWRPAPCSRSPSPCSWWCIGLSEINKLMYWIVWNKYIIHHLWWPTTVSLLHYTVTCRRLKPDSHLLSNWCDQDKVIELGSIYHCRKIEFKFYINSLHSNKIYLTWQKVFKRMSSSKYTIDHQCNTKTQCAE